MVFLYVALNLETYFEKSDFLENFIVPFFFEQDLKLKWANYCVLSTTGVDNANANSNDIIFIIKDTKLYVPVVTLSARDNQKLSNHVSKGFERSVYLE